MKAFIKKYIKPILNTIGVYTAIRVLYFTFIKIQAKITNLYRKKFFRTAPIFLYHRIFSASNDPTMLCVSEKTFENHLSILKENYDVIPLSELSKRIITKTLIGNEAAITFDDGYKDNLENALPLLKKYNLPATIFITTGSLGQNACSEWDLQYTESDRAVFLNEVEIRLLSNNPLIEIGAHTENHHQLSGLTEERQKLDILTGKEKLEKIIGKKIYLFAYPFGEIHDFNVSSQKVLSELGFSFAFSNTGIVASIADNEMSIPRINTRENTSLSLFKR